MELIGITFISNLRDEKVMGNGIVFRVYERVAEYLNLNDISEDIHLLLLHKISLDPVYLISIPTENGKVKAYSLKAVIDALYSKLLEEREDLVWKREQNLQEKAKKLGENVNIYDELKKFNFNKIIGIVSFPLIDRNPYFGYYEKFLGIHKKIGEKEVMVLSIKPFFSEDADLLVDRVAKGILHEIGHSYGLDHCENSCIMHPPKNIRDWDRRRPYFCAECLTELKKNAGWI